MLIEQENILQQRCVESRDRNEREDFLLASICISWSCQSIADDLVKASQNPIGDMVSLPFEVWHFSHWRNPAM
jgi:hypothetical protein